MPSTMPVAKPPSGLKSEFLPPAKVHKLKLPIGFPPALYAKVPEIYDVHPLFHKDFVEKYDLCFEGLCPKCIKVSKDVTLEDVLNNFGQVVNRNGYNYVHCENLELVVKVERLFMIIHQKSCVPATWIILVGMARGIVCEENRKKMNWAAYAGWRNGKQCRHKFIAS
jgi:hypothetical protein